MYKLAAKYYDLIHQSHTGDIDLFVELAKGVNGPVLDIGCGSGRLVIPLAEAGIEIVGIDKSADMIDVAKGRLIEEGVHSELLEQDILTWETDQQFDLIILGMNTLMEFNDQGVMKLLKKSASLISANGKIIIDVIQPFIMAALDNADGGLAEDEPLNDNGRKLPMWSGWTADHEKQQVEIKWRIQDDAERIEFSNLFHYHYLDQLMDHLPLANLEIDSVWGDYEKNAYNEESDRMLPILKTIGG